MTAPVPSPDLREALATVEQWHTYRTSGRWELLPNDVENAITLADEIYRLRAQLADETTRRQDLAVELTGTWGDQCAAMAAVVRAAERWARADITSEDGGTQTLLNAIDTFVASGWLPTIELTEDADA